MSIVTSIFDVFSSISDWIVSAVADVTPMFWDAQSGLTFMGTLALLGLGVGIVFLIIGIVQKFLTFGA